MAYLLFFLSGAAALMYESVWTRYLGLFVGHDAYAQVVVLVIFLGGMSAGAWIVSRRSASIARPLQAYALVELAVGLIGLVFHDVFVGATALAYDHLFPALGSAAAVDTVKWVLAALLILPQSILLGTTFPLMSAAVLRAQRELPGRVLSWLYFTNSLGAAIGVLLAGFVLVDLAGLPGVLVAAAAVNLIVALGAMVLGRRSAGAPPAPFDTPAADPAPAGDANPATSRAPAPRDGVRDSGRIVRLRDRLDPNAVTGARERHALVRVDALGIHPRARARCALHPPKDRPTPASARHAGVHPDRDGAGGGAHASVVRGIVLMDSQPVAGVHPHR